MAHWLFLSGHLKVKRQPPVLPVATSITDVEHILHIPAMVLQASVCNISLDPGKHCRLILNSSGFTSWYTPGTEQEEHDRKRTVGKKYEFEKRRKPAQMKRKDPFWVTGWHNLSTWRADSSSCFPGLDTPPTQGYWPKKSPQNSL